MSLFYTTGVIKHDGIRNQANPSADTKYPTEPFNEEETTSKDKDIPKSDIIKKLVYKLRKEYCKEPEKKTIFTF